MGHESAQTGLVAADAAVNRAGLSAHYFIGPLRVGDELSAHGGAVHAPGVKLFLDEVGVIQSSDSAYRQVGDRPDGVAEGEEAPLVAEVGMFGRWDRVGEGGVVGQRHMETGDARPLQQRDKDRQLRNQDTGIAVVGVLHADGQLVVDGHVGKPAPDGGHRFHGKAGTVYGAAAVAVGPVVEDR